MRLRTFVVGLVFLAVAAAGAALGARYLWSSGLPTASQPSRPVLAAVPPLPAASGGSVITVPITIPLTAIRDALEAAAPRELNGKREYSAAKFVSNAEIGWAVTRGPLAVYGKPEMLAATAALGGTLRATGQLSAQATDRIGSALGGIIGQDAVRNIEKLAAKPLDQRAELKGTVIMLSQPSITAQWRFEPKLTPQLLVTDVTMSIGGTRLNISNEVKPLLEKQVAEQVAALEERLRNDPFLEQAARREWAKLCRAFPLGAANANLPNLWLELRPTRAVAAQPRIDAESVLLLLGVEAETRIVPQQTTPDCPFPATLSIIPQSDAGRVRIAMPIDVPFTEVNRLIAGQLAGRIVPDDKSSGLEVTVRSASVAPSGDRLVISLGVTARDRTSWLGLASEATVHIRGRPALDSASQVLRLTEVGLDVDSPGVLGSAARAAVPYLERAVAERAVIDLKPLAVNARRSIEQAIAEFSNARDDAKVEAALTDLRITGLAFDATTLRIVAEADGTAKAAVNKLPQR